MIERERRQQAARIVDGYARGEIDSDELENSFPSSGGDDALEAIDSMLWFTFDDFDPKPLVPGTADHAADAPMLERMSLFLKVGGEYAWPDTRFRALRGVNRLIDAITFGAATRRRRAEYDAYLRAMSSIGDWNAWPFLSQAEVDEARAKVESMP